MSDPKIPTPRECGRATWWLVRYTGHVVFVEGAEVKNAKGKVTEESTRSTRVGVAAFAVFLLIIFGKRYPDLWLWAGGGLAVVCFGLAATGDFTVETEEEEEDHGTEGGQDQDEDPEALGEQQPGPSPAEMKAAGEQLTRKILRYVNIHTSGGTKGVHLDSLAAHLDLSLTALREHCEREGWEVVSFNIKRGGQQANRIGVRRDFLERLYGAPLPAVIQQLERDAAPPPEVHTTAADHFAHGLHILRNRPSPDTVPDREAG
ncbi:hypothetical protein [Streptomyces sp. AP-93]|uniref:hypothetical protein n=1 Tax=Streptomyces sp. AP-93 TaxID=2929048 RepID=UPI001FAF5775|nr:hypothetical protein [Streptomyces sp. AP-93]MCJ0868070.1 hypothetical protein [Streptomyces sp. AP-93]